MLGDGLPALLPSLPQQSSLPSLPSLPSVDAGVALSQLPALPVSSVPMKFDTVNVTAARQKVPWGIYQNSKPVVQPDSVVAFDYRIEWQIADYPQEDGAFQSYNKVAKPFDIRLRMTKGGKEADRISFLAALEKLVTSLEVCDVTTPENTYVDVNVTGFDYARSATNGVGMLTVDLTIRQVRITARAAFAKTAQPSGADAVSGGTVQAQEPTAAQAAPSADAPTAPASENAAPAPAPASAAPAAPATTFPPGYTQSSETGLIYDSSGKVDRDMSAKVGPGETTGLPAHSEDVQRGSTTVRVGG